MDSSDFLQEQDPIRKILKLNGSIIYREEKNGYVTRVMQNV